MTPLAAQRADLMRRIASARKQHRPVRDLEYRLVNVTAKLIRKANKEDRKKERQSA